MSPIDPDELNILKDTSFLTSKRQIDTKVTRLLLESQKQLADWVVSNDIQLPAGMSLAPRKIAKGENYADMPYWVSDFPASMKSKDIWTFRTVVWWGHHISFSLIIAGKYKVALDFQPEQIKVPDLYFTLANNPWKLEFVEDIQKESEHLSPMEMKQHFESHDFLKVSLEENLEMINNLHGLIVLSFEKLIRALGKLA